MCLYDVKRARASHPNVAADDATPDGTTSQYLVANPNRTAVVVTARWETPVADDDAVELRAGTAAGPVVGFLTKYAPSCMMTLVQLGAVVGYAQFFRKYGAANINVTYSEILMDIPDDLQ